MVVDEEPTCSVATFDPSNAACEGVCTQTAPQGWPGCTTAADQLMKRGYTCLRPTPYMCQAPATSQGVCPASGCRPFPARVIRLAVRGGSTEITISAGANHGLTAAWHAMLVDGNRRPVPDGEIVLERIDVSTATGGIQLPPSTIAQNPLVWLSP